MNDIKIIAPDEVSEDELRSYVDYVSERLPKGVELKSLDIKLNNDGTVVLDYQTRARKFERIRRITGYLVGTTDRWNNAKKAELNDRVKHA